MKKSIIGIAALVSVLSACNIQEADSLRMSKEVSFYAVNGDASKTKTVIQEDGKIWWSPQDEINIFYGESGNSKFTSTNTSASANVEFKGSLNYETGKNEYWAVYPYSSDNTFDGSSFGVTLPSEQYAVAGSFKDDLFISVATTTDNNLVFYNVCGGVKFTVTQPGVTSVVFKGNNNEALAGTASVSFDSYGKPYIKSVSDAKTQITVTLESGSSFAVGTWYYIVSFPATLSSGYSMTLKLADGKQSVKTGSNPVTIKRSIWGVLKDVDPSSESNTPDAVDLGLSVKWASFNVGATAPHEYGDYFAWGETEVKTNYGSWGTYKWCNGSETKLTKYCPTDGKIVIEPEDDAAYVNLGHKWRMPTDEEWSELIQKCSWTWTDNYYRTGVKGMIVAGANGNSIFLPAAGGQGMPHFDGDAEYTGDYWSSSLNTTQPNRACYLYFDSSEVSSSPYGIRCFGLPIRPVCEDNDTDVDEPEIERNYMKFVSEGKTYINITNITKTDSQSIPIIKYSFNKSDWEDWNGTTIYIEKSRPVYIKGYNLDGFTKDPQKPHRFISSGDNFRVYGDVLSLVYGEYFNDVDTLSDYCFYRLFYGCEQLTNSPTLSSKTLAKSCYEEMFKGCTNLTKAPELPATTLAENCYKGMFADCSSLTNAPQLPAKSLTEDCYEEMFKCCTSLTEAPELPAIYVAESCYKGMFGYCTNLTKAPELPAKYLAENCYAYMFEKCASLTQAPDLPATTLAVNCYAYMFFYCNNIKESPKCLPATNLEKNCYKEMFAGCSSLTQAPDLPATTLAENCYESMFYGCTNLTQAPELPATNLDYYYFCYRNMFQCCTSLTKAPELPAITIVDCCYENMFAGCTSLTSAPSILPATTLSYSCYAGMFAGCSSLTEAPELPAKNLSDNLADDCYYSMFAGCTSLMVAPDLPAKALAENCYAYMFEKCTSLTQAPKLPATTLAKGCYENMFAGCTSLMVAPDLPATTLAPYCYGGMFIECANLNYIKCLATDISASGCVAGWVNHVASEGLFIKSESMNSWPSGPSGIPSGWTVKND